MKYNRQNVQKMQAQRAQLQLSQRFNAQQNNQFAYPMPSHIQMSEYNDSVFNPIDNSTLTPNLTQTSRYLQQSYPNNLSNNNIPNNNQINYNNSQITNETLHTQILKNDYSMPSPLTKSNLNQLQNESKLSLPVQAQINTNYSQTPSYLQTPSKQLQNPQLQQQYQQQLQQQQDQLSYNPQMYQNQLQNQGWQGQVPIQGTVFGDQKQQQQQGLSQDEEKMTLFLLSGPIPTRSPTDIWALVLFVLNFLCWISIGIVGFATCDPFDMIDKIKATNGAALNISFDVSQFFDGLPAAAATFGITFLIGMGLQVILMRFTFCILMSILISCLVLILAGAIFGFVAKQIVIGVLFIIIFLFYLFFAYHLYKKLPALDQIAKMAYQFSIEMAGQYCLTFTFLLIFMLEFIYYLFGMLFLCSKYTVSSDYKVVIEPTYQSLAYAFTWNFLWLTNTTMQLYKFCVTYMCCQWYFGRANQVSVMECLKLGFNHLGSLAFQSLLVFLLYYVVYIIKNIEKQFRKIYLVCVAEMIKRCRKPMEKLISSLTIIRIAHEGSNFCESSKQMLKQLFSDPFYFLFVIWGADTVSGLLSFFTFAIGFGLGIYLLILMKVGTMALIVGILIIYVVANQITEVFVQNFQMVLYSIGAYYNLCETLYNKNSQSVKSQKFFEMRDKISSASSLTNLSVKDLA